MKPTYEHDTNNKHIDMKKHHQKFSFLRPIEIVFFFKCLGRRSDRRYILYIRWVRFWLFCHLDDWFLSFFEATGGEEYNSWTSTPFGGEDWKMHYFSWFWLVFHIQCSSGPLSGGIKWFVEDIPSLKLLDVPMQYWFTWEFPKVSLSSLSRQKKHEEPSHKKNPRGTGNVSKWLWSLLVFRDPNIGQHAHMIRIILAYVLCTDCS